MFDLYDHQRFGVGNLQISEQVVGAVAVGAPHSAAADPARRITAGCHRGFRLFRRIDHRDDDARGCQVQDRLENPRIIVADPDERCAARAPAGGDMSFDRVEGERTVFRIDPDEIQTAVAGAFADGQIGQGDHRADGGFSRGDGRFEFFQVVDLHIGPLSLVFSFFPDIISCRSGKIKMFF